MINIQRTRASFFFIFLDFKKEKKERKNKISLNQAHSIIEKILVCLRVYIYYKFFFSFSFSSQIRETKYLVTKASMYIIIYKLLLLFFQILLYYK